MNAYFTKEDTRVIKGIAVMLMLMLIHHLYFFPDRMIGNGLSCQLGVWEQNFVQYISAFGKICVSIFFFLSGYGIYKSAIKRKLDLIARLNVNFLKN